MEPWNLAGAGEPEPARAASPSAERLSPPDDTLIEGLDPEVVETLETRRTALRRAGRMGRVLAFASAPVALGLLARNAYARQGLPQQIVDVLNFALTLEELEADFYRRGVAAAGLVPVADLPIITVLRDHEVAHVALLRQALGPAAIARPGFDFTAGGAFPDVFSNYQTFLLLAQAFEDTGVRAYKGQAANLMANKDVLTTALRIHSVEARHASMVRRMRGLKGWITGAEPPADAVRAVYAGEDNVVHAGLDATSVTFVPRDRVTEAYDEPLTREEVLAIAGPFVAAGVTLDFGDVFGVLNYAFALEQLEAAFYLRTDANPYPGITAEERTIIRDLRDHEVAHREFFKAAIPALGGTAIGQLTFDFSMVDFSSRQSVLETARTFEDLGVSAYNGAARFVGSNETALRAAGEIVAVEARHASVIRSLLQPKTNHFAPDVLDLVNTPQTVLQAAQPFIANRIATRNLPA